MIELLHWFFLLLIPVITYLFFKKRKQSLVKFSNVNLLKSENSIKKYRYKIGKYLICLGCLALIIALARPRIPKSKMPVTEKGIAIGLLLDVSGSMESVDFTPNRLSVAKNTIESFINKRSTDEIALIAFAGNAFTRIPLTLDHDILIRSLSDLNTSSIQEEGTAIGMAESVGLNRLKKSDAKSKILILVTDGDNNAGAIDPLTASQLASKLGVKIYTIGVGTDKTILPYDYFGTVRYQQIEGGLNETLLTEIATVTGGEYFRAKDIDALDAIFEHIDQLEKSDFEGNNFREYYELAFIFILFGVILLIVGLFFDRYYFIQIP